MRLALLLPAPDARARVLRRALPFLLVLAAHILIIVVLLTLAPPRKASFGDDSRLTVLQLAPQKKAEAQRKPTVVKVATKRRATPPPPAPVPPPEMPIELRNLLRIDLARSDIGTMPSNRPAPEATADAGEAGQDSPAFTGPGGERLYEADWQTRPTQAQLAAYMPRNGTVAEGYGLIACRTVPRFRLEDCQFLAERPAGSGLAGAVLQAAWQFRVLPPRIGGRALVGSWVRIRIDYTKLPPK